MEKKLEKKLQKNISYIIQFIDSARFMAISLSNLVDNISERFNRIKCKVGHEDKILELVELNVSIVTVFLNTQIQDNLMECKSLCCLRKVKITII